MSLINVKNLTFAHEGSYDNIFDDVSFRLDTDWRLGFTGRNGRGKTTFLNLLLGKYEYRGKIEKSVDFEYFPFEIDDKSAYTYGVIEKINPAAEQWELVRELNYLGISEEVLYRPFNSLSEGERTKILLAVLFLKENSFLLIDEPTNHLDADGRKVVGDYLNSKRGFILVSHDRVFLDNCIDHILSINKTGIEVQKGDFSTWLSGKEQRDNFELAENEKLKKDIRRLEKTAKEKAAWSDKVEATKIGAGQYDRGFIGHKAAKMMKRSKSIEKRAERSIEEKSGLLKNIENAEELKLSPAEYYKETLCMFRNFSIFYDGRQIFREVDFSVERGDRIALCGKNGTGKSSVLKLIMGEGIKYGGEALIGSNLIVSYISQDTSGLKGGLSQYAEEEKIDESLFKAILRKLDFSREQFDKDISVFSGGQKKKVLIARSLCQKAHLYIWDEPLNYVDVISRMQIERLILEYKPTILFVEHDAAFCDNIATKKVIL